MSTDIMLRLRRTCLLAAFAVFGAVSSEAAPVVFATDPFAGSTALTTPGRQVVGSELFLPTFNVALDLFALDPLIFNLSSLTVFNGLVSALPTSGVNVVVLQDTDDDGNSATAFGAGNAATLIANRITADGPGLFIYHNSGLSLNRLVFSTNLNDATADLKILARIQSPTGAAAVSALPAFTAANFTLIPEPGSLQLLGGAALLLAVGAWRRRRGA
jgi:hypothetical protein